MCDTGGNLKLKLYSASLIQVPKVQENGNISLPNRRILQRYML